MSAAARSSPARASRSAVVTRSMTRHCSRRTFAGRKTFRQVNRLSRAAGGEQSADADLTDSKGVEEDFVSLVDIQGLDTLPGDRVEQVRLSGLGGGAGEQNQCGATVGWVIV
jgi:hypothetical protein